MASVNNSLTINNFNTENDNRIRKYPCIKKIHEICVKILNFFRVIGAMCRQTFGLSDYKIIQIDLHNIAPKMQKKLKEFENSFVYPFDSERCFRIIHGKGEEDYLGFFKRMGDCKFYVAINKKDRTVQKTINGKETTVSCKAGEIAAVGCGVLRKIPYKNNKTLKAWYICDLKVAEKFRGEHLPVCIFQKAIWRFFQCSRGYGICMNPSNNSEPQAAKIWKNHGTVKGHNSLTINLYNLSFHQIQEAKDKIEKILGGNQITFKSMKGIKEFEIFSKESPNNKDEWKLLHIQHGPLEEKELSESNMSVPQQGYDHMIAAVEGSDLDEKLKDITFTDGTKLSANSTATMIYRGIEPTFFCDKILTNEI